ncbi:MAG: hypothetical protein ACYTG6_09500 [Planctomycetota bacterium]|jgi:hypothetical protein
MRRKVNRQRGEADNRILILVVIVLVILALGWFVAPFWWVAPSETGGEPPYVEHFRLLNSSRKQVDDVKVEIKQVSADPWIDTGLALPSPLGAKQAWLPDQNATPGRVLEIQVTVTLEGTVMPALTVGGLVDDDGTGLGANDTDVTVVVRPDDSIQLYVAYNRDGSTFFASLELDE